LVRNVGGLHIVCNKGIKDRTLLKQGSDGTGQYKVAEAVPGDHYTLTRRKEYAWGSGDFKADQPGMPDKVVLKVVANETTAANLLLAGQVNIAAITGPDKAGWKRRSCSLVARALPLASSGSTRRPAYRPRTSQYGRH